MIALIWAGWTLQPMVGEPSAEALAETELRVAHCPPRQQDFVARQQGEKTVLGPVAGSGETRDLGEIEACLRAGLRAKPLADGVAVRVVYEEPRAEVWSGNVTGILDTLVGPSPGDCLSLRFPVTPDGTLGKPEVVGGSGDNDWDFEALAKVMGYPQPLPPVPEGLRAHFGEDVVLCVGMGQPAE